LLLGPAHVTNLLQKKDMPSSCCDRTTQQYQGQQFRQSSTLV
jgi:hypothetical protein